MRAFRKVIIYFATVSAAIVSPRYGSASRASRPHHHSRILMFPEHRAAECLSISYVLSVPWRHCDLFAGQLCRKHSAAAARDKPFSLHVENGMRPVIFCRPCSVRRTTASSIRMSPCSCKVRQIRMVYFASQRRCSCNVPMPHSVRFLCGALMRMQMAEQHRLCIANAQPAAVPQACQNTGLRGKHDGNQKDDTDGRGNGSGNGDIPIHRQPGTDQRTDHADRHTAEQHPRQVIGQQVRRGGRVDP